MSIRYGFFNSVNGDRTYNAEDFTDIFEGIVTDGVFYNQGNKFNVQKDPQNIPLGFIIQSGRAMFEGKYFEVVEPEKITLSNNPSGKRIDYICLVFDFQNRLCKIDSIMGTVVQDNPVPPTIPTEEGAKYYPIASVKMDGVVTSAQDVSKVSITQLVGTSLCPWASVAFSPDRAIMLFEEEVPSGTPTSDYCAGQLTINKEDIPDNWYMGYPAIDGSGKLLIQLTFTGIVSNIDGEATYIPSINVYSDGTSVCGAIKNYDCYVFTGGNQLTLRIDIYTDLAYSTSNVNLFKGYLHNFIIDYIIIKSTTE